MQPCRVGQTLRQESPTRAKWDYPQLKLAAEQVIHEERVEPPTVILCIAGVYNEIGSSAHPGYRDFAMSAEIDKGKHAYERVCCDVNPSSRQILENFADMIDETYARRAKALKNRAGHIVIGGENYGQGSSREHATLAPRYLGLRVIIAKSFARIHWQNLINFGIVPLVFVESYAYDAVQSGDELLIRDLQTLRDAQLLEIENTTRQPRIAAEHTFSPRQVEILLSGGLISWIRQHA